MYRTGCGVLIDALRRGKKPAHVIHATLAGSGNNGSAIHAVKPGKSGNIGRERSHLLGLIDHHEVIARFHYQRRFQPQGR